jgi:hypothetical protein
MNSERFLASQQTYFSGAYDQFCAFGGPCIYFHRECLRAGEQDFASSRHIEMIYATLTAWGMHRMGNVDRTKTKLTEWEPFSQSLYACAAMLAPLRGKTLLGASEREYADVVASLRPAYQALKLSASGATIVVNAKALYHLLPGLIPPIDRQYTIRFFTKTPDKWRNRKGKFKPVMLPADADAQFVLFQTVCAKVKRLADCIDPALFEREHREHGVTPPKAIDNAIVNYVRIVSNATVDDLVPT